MRRDPLTPMENAELDSPSADTTPRFGWDQRIRERGYRILRRPAHGEPVWERNGHELTHSEVLARERFGE